MSRRVVTPGCPSVRPTQGAILVGVIRLASYTAPLVLLKPLVAVLTASLVIAGIILSDHPDKPTIDRVVVTPPVKVGGWPSGPTLPTPGAAVAGGTATAAAGANRTQAYRGGSVF